MMTTKIQFRPIARRVLAVCLCLSIVSTPIAVSTAQADSGQSWSQVATQVSGDVIQAGITLAASATGNVPLALTAGIVGKYISTYGIQGIKDLVDAIKGYPPQDLGEVNLDYMYLINVKRNMYSTLIAIRKSAEAAQTAPGASSLAQELDALQQDVTTLCAAGNCQPVTVDEKLVNYSYLQVALDAKASLDVDQWLSVGEIKNTYEYLMLLYLDVVMTEQQLIQTQNLVVGNQVKDAIAALKANDYISDAEKEYQAQMVMNIALRWQKMLDERRVLLANILTKPTDDLLNENKAIQDDLDKLKKSKPAGKS